MGYSSFTNTSWERFRTLWKKWFPKVKKTFMGSLDEWNALTPAEQAEYDLLITPEEVTADDDTEWVLLEKSSAVTSGSPKIMRKGNVVTFSVNNLAANITSYGADILASVLPSRYRPPSGAGIVMSVCGENASDAVTPVSVYISHAGDCKVQVQHNTASVKYVSVVMTYLVTD